MEKSSLKKQSAIFRKLERAFRSLSKNPSDLPHDITLLERTERIATDSPFQLIRKQFAKWRFERSPESLNSSLEDEKANNAFLKAYRAWLFGRPISKSAKNTYQFLRNSGLSRRDLRIAVFTKMVQKDGSIKINWWKIRFTRLLSLTLIIITVTGLGDLLLRLLQSHVSWWVSLIVFCLTAMLIAILEYPLMVLGLRPPKVAAQIQRLNVHKNRQMK